MDKAKVVALSIYLAFFTLPFLWAYFAIWFFGGLSSRFQIRNPDAPRWLRWTVFGLMWSLAIYSIASCFIDFFHLASVFLHIYLLLQAGLPEESSNYLLTI